MALTVEQLLNPPTYEEVKQETFDRLEAAGFTAIESYAPESLPVALVEVESRAQDQENQAGAYVVAQGYNQTASDSGLDNLSEQLFDDFRFLGVKASGFVTLSDPRGLGPFKFSPLSVGFSVGIGGLEYSGVAPNGVDPVTIPRGGSARVYVEAADVGSDYNAGVGEIDTWVRGTLAGVTVTNPSGWQADQYGASGTPAEEDASLQRRNVTKWGTLSQFKPTTMVQSGYEAAARNASQEVTRVRVETNLDLTDPGRVDVIVAGEAGALAPSVVAAVQLALSPTQTGGPNISESARCAATSAVNLAVTVSGTVIVEATYNNAAFLATVNRNLATWFGSFLIGGGRLGRVSYERVLGLISLPAGTTNSVVLDATDVKINGGTQDLAIQYNQVPVLTSQLVLQSI